ncbi:MAG: hypothetical protein ACT4OV_11630 [Microthrixaceae bacterium]
MTTEINNPSLGPPELTFVAVAIVVVVLSAPFVPSPGISKATLVVVAALVEVERDTARVVLVTSASVVVEASELEVVDSSGTVVVDSVVVEGNVVGGQMSPGFVVTSQVCAGAAEVVGEAGSSRTPSTATTAAIKSAAMRPLRDAPPATDVSLAHRGRRQGTTSAKRLDRMPTPGTGSACQSVGS